MALSVRHALAIAAALAVSSTASADTFTPPMVYFAPGSAELSIEQRDKLFSEVNWWISYTRKNGAAIYCIDVNGYADGTALERAHSDLASRRAATVLRELDRWRLLLAPARVQAYGSARLTNVNLDGKPGTAFDRRVEVQMKSWSGSCD